jgi:hypothetical protein
LLPDSILPLYGLTHSRLLGSIHAPEPAKQSFSHALTRRQKGEKSNDIDQGTD